MFGTRRSSLQCLAFALTLHIAVIAGEFFKPFNVTYDHHALIIDGKRRMLYSAGIHYPRATPEIPAMNTIVMVTSQIPTRNRHFGWRIGMDGTWSGVEHGHIDLLKTLHLQSLGFLNVEGAFRIIICLSVGRILAGLQGAQTTSYDYDAPIDEYGLLRQPRWGHLKDLHDATKLCEPALVAVDSPQYVKLGPKQEAHLYGVNVHSEGQTLTLSGNKSTCSAFLASIDEHNAAVVTFFGQVYTLPPWSVSILPDCRNTVFNTAKDEVTYIAKTWLTVKEPIGAWGEDNFTVQGILEHLNVTKDRSDYLWYTTRIMVLSLRKIGQDLSVQLSLLGLEMGILTSRTHYGPIRLGSRVSS
ncbi:hypothetical protein ACSBR2_030533 [Camellia fascicularis]